MHQNMKQTNIKPNVNGNYRVKIDYSSCAGNLTINGSPDSRLKHL